MYKLEIVTPQGVVFSDDVDMTTVNTADGEIGILENHMLLLTNLKPGKITIEKEGQEPVEYAATFGTVDVAGNKVIILAEEVYKISEIDVEKEIKIYQEAKEKLENKEGLSLQEILKFEELKERAEALLKLAGVNPEAYVSP